MTLYKCIQPENVTVKQARQFSHVGLVRSTMNNAQAKHCSFRTEPHHKKSTMPKNNRPHAYVLSKVTCRNLKCEAFVVCKRVRRWPIRSDPTVEEFPSLEVRRMDGCAHKKGLGSRTVPFFPFTLILLLLLLLLKPLPLKGVVERL